jgi:hypothetical protein
MHTSEANSAAQQKKYRTGRQDLSAPKTHAEFRGASQADHGIPLGVLVPHLVLLSTYFTS